MKRILLTGAAGLLGAVSLKVLVQAGYEVVAAYRPDSPYSPAGNITKTIELDLGSDAGWESLPDQIDVVIHCAALVPTRVNDIRMVDQLWKVNALGTLKLLEWARNNGVKRFIYCSSHSVYARPLPLPVTEDHATYPSGHASPYALTKLAGEVFATSMNSADFRVCSLRFSSLYGARMKHSGVLFHFITMASQGHAIKISAHPTSQFDFIYVKDAAQAIYLVLTSTPIHPIYNIGAGRGTTVPELAEAAWSIFAQLEPMQINNEPDRSNPVHNVLDVSRAQTDLGYQPAYTIHSGLQDMKTKLDVL